MTTEHPATIRVGCDYCQGEHLGYYSHPGQFGEGPIYAVVCDTDPKAVWLTDYVTLEARL